MSTKMSNANIPARKIFRVVTSLFILLVILSIQSCEEKIMSPEATEFETDRKNPNPPPPPPTFYFTNCNNPTYSATFVKGTATNTAIIKNYINSPGGSYTSFTSETVNGITITAPAGTFNTGSGAVTFTATGTPVNTGTYNVWIRVGNIQSCMMFFRVVNAPASGPTVDPGPAFGSTGVINFTYRGQSVAYTTVRAEDGRIWLQQNLGAPQVAFGATDDASYGDFFQWGRWDDGHQLRTSPVISSGSSLMNPSHIVSGNPNFISGWWSTGGSSTDTWRGSLVSSTNGKDPCTALGPGWRLPTSAEWVNVALEEDLFGTLAAFDSNLKLTSSGNRSYSNGDIGYYWSNNAVSNTQAKVFFFDDIYNADVGSAPRGEAFNCRCIKE